MNILVTGSTGLIGSALVNRLSTKYPQAKIYCAYYSSPHLLNQPQGTAEIIMIPYEKIINSTSITFSYIWHFATYAQPYKFISDWQNTYAINTSDVAKLIKILEPTGKFIFASSSEIYGAQENATENTIPSSYTCQDRSIYIDSKKLGETILFKSLKKESFYIFRICLVYSEIFKSTDRRVLYDFVRKAIKTSEIKLLDDGRALRQYLHISDCINMMFGIIDHFDTRSIAYSSPIFNISNPDPISILELANLVARNLNCEVLIPESGKENNPLSALSRVSVLPVRFLDIFPNYKFIHLEAGIQNVCKNALKMCFK